MSKYKALAIATHYWRPKTDFIGEIVEAIRGKVVDGDFVVVSEKAISTAIGNIVDENIAEPNLSAKLICRFWMRIVWGYFLGFLCHLRRSLILHLREYPLDEGYRHKQVAIQYAGFLQALMFGSEGGIDGSNLAYSYVSLPLKNAEEIAQKIRDQIILKLHKDVCVMITDTDKTYSFRNFHFTSRSTSLRGIYSFNGFLAYVVGRMLKLRRRATPIAVAGCELNVENALEIAEIANRARGYGAGRTVWEMAEKFKVNLGDVSWEMLETVKHKPIVIVRSKR